MQPYDAVDLESVNTFSVGWGGYRPATKRWMGMQEDRLEERSHFGFSNFWVVALDSQLEGIGTALAYRLTLVNSGMLDTEIAGIAACLCQTPLFVFF